ncbi:MAG: tRNA (adenosine(37)-N6)-threonylcarbamoyltransferase complex transferase subunit TsaD [Candidatus Sumerlaeota bacterium]|nr:tRNA (adenosine(37)-N6)-threonylcarbamoyltransferase complex transferase subunit TsaD [Candidatus Sumerlaeota bacterium]
MNGLTLGIETSCDETACAVVTRESEALSNAIASQVELHASYGGVVPELASRAHLANMIPIYEAALRDAGVAIGDISAIAVTRGPGLVGSLLVGLETAKSLGYVHHLPVRGIHHVAAHVYSPFVHGRAAGGEGFLPAGFDFPYLALAVSGGHTSLIVAEAPDRLRTIGRTVDDAAGEAYDKVARLLGLGYPGGPLIDRLAAEGDSTRYAFTRARLKTGGFNFSFSGLKTAIARLVEREGSIVFAPERPERADLAASFQAAVIDSLLTNCERALESTGFSRLAVVGGVACNRGLRCAAAERLRGVSLVFPPPLLCTDNAAMVAALGAALGERAGRVELSTNVDTNLSLEQGTESGAMQRA